MQGHDARILRGAAIPTVIAGALAAAAAFFMAGTHGLYGALAGIVLVMVFFPLGLLAVSYVARINPQLMMAGALGSYLLKVLVLGVLLVALRGTPLFDHTAFALTAALCAVVWIGGQTWATATTKILYVDPDAGR
ncbi:hypothetical protein [Allonocardiopsis opalescens]|uniref:ATP synthase protein I n=1 Tax=Allonocardiopsis opalescens TaxID=1144618 RepID=A0A2T0QCV3_9ACTN|nr:hypothetical protein [Allonocardiopsis opalescens]PRY01784.1 ATP synthase protein I [Allonocardiopsis opalescens]